MVDNSNLEQTFYLIILFNSQFKNKSYLEYFIKLCNKSNKNRFQTILYLYKKQQIIFIVFTLSYNT